MDSQHKERPALFQLLCCLFLQRRKTIVNQNIRFHSLCLIYRGYGLVFKEVLLCQAMMPMSKPA